jgi:hypothetical protein
MSSCSAFRLATPGELQEDAVCAPEFGRIHEPKEGSR